MKLYERFGDSGFHTSIVTSFGVDFDAYENIVLPRLRGGSCFNNVLLADPRMLTYALDGASLLPKHAGRHYTVSGVTAKGVFHPKVTLQLGRRSGRVIISSANITASGLAGNVELAGLVECGHEPNGEQRIVAAAWRYLRRLITADQQAILQQFDWMQARTPWLFEMAPAEEPVSLTDGSLGAFLTADGARGIASQFLTLAEARGVQRLIVLSPYWDEDLAALRYLATALQAKEILLLVDCEKQLFPKAGLHDLPPTKIYDLGEFAQHRFVHAKAIIAETGDADHVLYGSANCTVAALGTDKFAGSNEEACLYRRLPGNTVLDLLGLSKILVDSSPIDTTALPPLSLGESIPLDEASRRSPGRFECTFDTLSWWPPFAATAQTDLIELLDAHGRELPCNLLPLATVPGKARRFQLSGLTERPSFARLRLAEGGISAKAVVTLVDVLRDAMKEARGKRAQSAAAQLSEETEESLWLMEVLNDLEEAEASLHGDTDPGIRRARVKAEDTASEDEFRTLSYEEFIAGRRHRSDDLKIARNSLSGSELSLVRNFLNRILALGDENEGEEDTLDDKAIAASLNLGDETSDAEKSLESGEELPTPNAPEEEKSNDTEERRKRAQALATQDQIVHAVERFNERIRAKAEAAHVTSFDVLRLRAILMVVARAGQACAPARKEASAPTSLQVLPCDESAQAWPKIVGRILFTFFGGNLPAIRNVQIEAIHDQIPDDILECWATCLWAAQACVLAASLHPELKRRFLSILTAQMQRTYTLIGLRRDELQSDRVKQVFASLNVRFAKRLGIDPEKIERSHAAACQELGAFAS